MIGEQHEWVIDQGHLARIVERQRHREARNQAVPIARIAKDLRKNGIVGIDRLKQPRAEIRDEEELQAADRCRQDERLQRIGLTQASACWPKCWIMKII